MSQGTRIFISVTTIILFFGLLLLIIWWWYAGQLDNLNQRQKAVPYSLLTRPMAGLHKQAGVLFNKNLNP